MTLVQSKAHLAIAHMQQMQVRMHTLHSCITWMCLVNDKLESTLLYQQAFGWRVSKPVLHGDCAVLHAQMAAGSLACLGCREAACLEVSASERVQTD